MRKIYKGTIFFIIVLVAFVILYFHTETRIAEECGNFRYKEEVVTIKKETVTVFMADTNAKQRCGLSLRASLEFSRGMLFVFEEPGRHGIWMKDMNFPIDILWIGSDLRIVDITANVSPESYPNVFYPREKALYVLELNAGIAKKYGILIGDQMSFK